jgi:WXG100 family type VII secretion target
LAVSRVRADYDGLAQIAKAFAQQAGAARQTLQVLKRQQEILRGGDWVGQGATKFYQEMDADILPAVTRLATALETAQRVVIQVSQTMKQAEEEAARYLNGPGVGRTPGPADAGAAAGAGAGAGTAAGQASGQTATPAARLLSGFSERTRQLAAQSPTVTAQLEALDRQRWTIQQGPAGGGSYADRQTHTLVIDGGDSPEYQVGGIAHEGAHALYGEPPYHPPTATMTRDQYVRLNVNEALQNEGNSQFNEVAARQEILDHGGPDIGTSGTQAAEYQRIYGEYRAGNLTREQAINQMGTAIGNDSTSTTHENYRVYYGHTFEDYWDNHVAPARNNP